MVLDKQGAMELAAGSGFNTALSHSPDVVVAVCDAQDVPVAVRYAVVNEQPVAVRATGPQESVPITGGLLSPTGTMTVVEVDAVAPTGLAPIPGPSSGIGVIGYTVDGWLSPVPGRAHGYVADHVTVFDIVTVDGEIRTITADTEPELFWAGLERS